MRHSDASTSKEMYDFSVLRDLRRQAGFTIAEVSEKSGVSIAVISKLERNHNLAELETLYRLARVYGMSATDVLALAEKRSAQRTDCETYHSGQFLFKKITYSSVQLYVAEAPADAAVTRPEVHQDDYEVLWVLEGELEVELPKEKHVLHAGDAIQFDAAFQHTYHTLKQSKLIILHLKKGKRF